MSTTPEPTPTDEPAADVVTARTDGRYGIAILDPARTDSPLRRYLNAATHHSHQEN